MKLRILLLLAALFIISACASSKDETKNDEVYVFDDIADYNKNSEISSPAVPVDTLEIPKVKYNYIIQLGAFTTQERADAFVKKNQKNTNYRMLAFFDPSLNYYLVQLPVVQERDEADRILRTLIEHKDFHDSFIKPVVAE